MATTRRIGKLVLPAVVVLGAFEPSGAQTPPGPAKPQTTAAAPGPDYDAGPMHRKLLGDGWRDLWVTPIDLPLFDIGSHAGGLEPIRIGGGMQTVTLHLREKDGWRDYMFRSVNKFPVKQAMPPSVRGTFIGGIVQDHVSSLFPASALVIPALLDAIGVLHVKPALYLMPDDPRLGIYQDTFANMVGMVELNPQEAPGDEPGFAESRKIKGTYGYLDDVRDDREHRLDERELFAARLVDFLVGDTDRSPDNMRFARFGEKGNYRWRPLPRDRDRASMDARGWLVALFARPLYPKLVRFDARYSLKGLTFASHEIDRRLLQRITRAESEEIALRVQRLVTDRVIDSAVAQLPLAWRTRTTETARLARTLKERRRRLPDVARDFYEWLATEVDIHGTDQNERATIERHGDGRLTVTVAGRGDSVGEAPFSRRTFLPSATNEVRVYLHDGDDIAVVKGASSDAITVRVIGGSGDDFLADSAGGGGTRFYDSDGLDEFVTARGTRVDLQHWDAPVQGAGLRLDAAWRPDWGKELTWGPAIDFAEGGGLVLGFGPRFVSYGFRKLPHRWRVAANLWVAAGSGDPGANFNADRRMQNSPLSFRVAGRANGYEGFRFYGFGNDSPEGSHNLALVDQDIIALDPAFFWQVGWRSRDRLGSSIREDRKVFPGLRPLYGHLRAGPVLLWTSSDAIAASPFDLMRAERPEAQRRAGGRVGLELERTDRGPAPWRGWSLTADIAAYPAVWDVDEPFGTAAASAALYLPVGGGGTTLAARLGGMLGTGLFPIQHAPGIGGRTTLRGFRQNRFTGETAATGSAELRVPVGKLPLLIRWDAGVFGLADVGRVWFEGRSPGGWHKGFGGGIWIAALGQAFSVAYARGEHHRFYFQRGLSF